jgi:hypothetical protein
MSTPVALPWPLVLRLPRVKFRKPRWPRGDQLALGMACFMTTLGIYYILCAVTGTEVWTFRGPREVKATDVVFDEVMAAYYWLRWWYSRREDNNDDDGSSAT